MSQSNSFVYSSEMFHYSDDMFHSSEQEELIISDEEFPLQPPRPSFPQSLPSPFHVSNEEFMSINLSQAISSVMEENYRREQIERMSAAYEGIPLRDYIERNREYIGRNTWLESPTTVCDVEDVDPPMVTIDLDIYGFSEDEIDNMEEQYRRFRYDDREARLNYYSSSDEGIPESAFDDTSSVGSISYDSDDDSVLQERYYDEWEQSIKWEVEDKTDPDEHPFVPQKKGKSNKETKTKFRREQRKQASVLSVKEQTERELTKREKKEIAKFHKSSNIQSSNFSKIKKSKEIQRQRTAKYAQLTQSHSTLKEELNDMYEHNKYNEIQKDEKSAAELENATRKKHEKENKYSSAMNGVLLRNLKPMNVSLSNIWILKA